MTSVTRYTLSAMMTSSSRDGRPVLPEVRAAVQNLCRPAASVRRMTQASVVVATGFGGPDVLRVVEQEVDEPGPGEILLEVRAAGVNPVDWKRYGGAMIRDPAALPMRLGMEAAGVVVAVGPDAEGATGPVAIGDEV